MSSMNHLSYRRVLALACVSALGLAACGGDDDDADTTAAETVADTVEETTPETVAETTPETVAETTPETVEDTVADTTAGTETTAAEGDAQVINVDLMEFSILLDAEIAAGTVTFEIENTGEFPHDMHVYRGTYAELPQKASGAVDDAAVVAEDNLGSVPMVQPGTATSLTVEFTPGTYTLICNLEGGGSSHAARGQIVEVVVA